MLIGGDAISNDVFTLGACFHVFFNVCLHSRSCPLRADWWKSDSSVDGKTQGNRRRNSNSKERRSCKLSFFPAPPPERPGEFARRLASPLNTVTTSK